MARWVVRVAILCLLFNLNFTLVAYWDLFVQTWGTESYIAAFAGPFIGLGCGYLLVSGLRVKDVGIRHATESTTAVRNIAPMLLMMIFPFGADPLVTVSITILNTVGITVVLLVRPDVEARCVTVGHSRNDHPASKRRPAARREAAGGEPCIEAELGRRDVGRARARRGASPTGSPRPRSRRTTRRRCSPLVADRRADEQAAQASR